MIEDSAIETHSVICIKLTKLALQIHSMTIIEQLNYQLSQISRICCTNKDTKDSWLQFIANIEEIITTNTISNESIQRIDELISILTNLQEDIKEQTPYWYSLCSAIRYTKEKYRFIRDNNAIAFRNSTKTISYGNPDLSVRKFLSSNIPFQGRKSFEISPIKTKAMNNKSYEVGQNVEKIRSEAELKRKFYSLCVNKKLLLPKNHIGQMVESSRLYSFANKMGIVEKDWDDYILDQLKNKPDQWINKNLMKQMSTLFQKSPKKNQASIQVINETSSIRDEDG